MIFNAEELKLSNQVLLYSHFGLFFLYFQRKVILTYSKTTMHFKR